MSRFLFVTVCIINLTASAQSDEQAIKDCFKLYKHALIDADGEEAADYVDQNTIAYYDKMLDMSLRADSATVQAANMIDKMTIFTVRHKIPRDTLASMDGKAFFSYAINSGMVGKNSVVSLDLGDIQINGFSASGEIFSAAQPTGSSFEFHKENGSWKIDITSIFEDSAIALDQMLQNNGMDENQYIFMMLEMITGQPASADIWHPM